MQSNSDGTDVVAFGRTQKLRVAKSLQLSRNSDDSMFGKSDRRPIIRTDPINLQIERPCTVDFCSATVQVNSRQFGLRAFAIRTDWAIPIRTSLRSYSDGRDFLLQMKLQDGEICIGLFGRGLSRYSDGTLFRELVLLGLDPISP